MFIGVYKQNIVAYMRTYLDIQKCQTNVHILFQETLHYTGSYVYVHIKKMLCPETGSVDTSMIVCDLGFMKIRSIIEST